MSTMPDISTVTDWPDDCAIALPGGGFTWNPERAKEIIHDTRMCDCGHIVGDHERFTGGYATWPDGTTTCYACADEKQRDALRTDTTAIGYLSSDGAHITTWTGGTLATVTYHNSVKRYGFYGAPYTLIYWRAVDVYGARWYGTSPGLGMYARMHRAKNRKG